MASSLASDRRWTRNELLTALPTEEQERLRPDLRAVPLIASQLLQNVNAPVDNIYFLEEGLVSLTVDTGDDNLVDVAVVGREGLAGGQALFSPGAISVHRALIQISGSALRMEADNFRDAVNRFPALRDRCLRHAHVVLAHVSRTAGCNARHDLPKRLARWLLAVHDRVDGDELLITQDFVACMLGVRRSSVSIVANDLHAKGLIRQGRGRITVLNRTGLEAAACNCYRLVEDTRQRVMGGMPKTVRF